jgi:hypothetical protein
MASPTPRLSPLAAAAGLLLSPSLQAAPSKAEVRASRSVNADARAIFEYVLDLRNQEALWPEGCTKGIELGDTVMGVGAEMSITYKVGIWRRSLDATISRAVPGERIDIDHKGDRGFTTTWTITPKGDTTRVNVDTWVGAPPRPFVRFYERRVQPGWTACHEGALDRLARALSQQQGGS